ncbi:MAG: hypothetical protein PHS34_08430 [Candidatus Omnitrophica bacterium]|nr:hypothetical protein [Candidatus Nanoarchaeia archaeon]MDD5551271.1 hypothetical protein [Candidatus Omnitrophota bacterium]
MAAKEFIEKRIKELHERIQNCEETIEGYYSAVEDVKLDQGAYEKELQELEAMAGMGVPT